KGELPPLPAPTNLTGVARPAGGVKLDWNAVTDAAAYVLQVKGPTDGDYQDLATPNAAVLSHVYVPTQDGAYSYRVASVRMANGAEATSAWSMVVTVNSDRVAPPPPTSLTVQVVREGVRADWVTPAPSAEVAGYQLYRD